MTIAAVNIRLPTSKQNEVSTMDNVTKANFNTRFSVQEDLEQDLAALIEKYDGQMSLAQFCGVLDVVKFSLLTGHSE